MPGREQMRESSWSWGPYREKIKVYIDNVIQGSNNCYEIREDKGKGGDGAPLLGEGTFEHPRME